MIVSLFVLFIHQASAVTTIERPSVRTLCAILDANKKPFIIVDFKTDIPTGISETGSHLDALYSMNAYPIKNYRVVASNTARYRVGVELLERAFFAGQYMFRMSVFEESQDGLVQRFSKNVPAKDVEPLFTFGTKPNNGNDVLSCQVTKLN